MTIIVAAGHCVHLDFGNAIDSSRTWDDATLGKPAATTQDIEVVRAIADRVVVMRSGKIIGLGPSNDVVCPPHQPCNDTRLVSVPDRALGQLNHINAKRMAKVP